MTKADIARLHHELRRIPYQANRNLEVISKMFNLAELWGLRPDGSNPRRHIKKYPEEKRERYLSPAELAALGEALSLAEQEGVEDPYAIAAIRLLIFTGCRLNEIMTLKWDYVDFEARCLRLPDSKTGARLVHLGAPALEVLSRIERLPDNPWVICGKKPGARRTDLQPPWRRFRKRATVRLWARAQGSAAADLVHRLERRLDREPTYDECLAAAKKQGLDLPTGLVDVRIHDLRHSFASGAVALGESLPMIGKLLGHTQVQTTARYAHLAADPVKAAAERVSSNIAALINGQTGEVVQLLPRTGEPRRARALSALARPMKRLEPLAPRRRQADHGTRRGGGADAEAAPRRDAGQGARPRAPLAAQNRERSGQVHHRPCGAGRRDRRLHLPAPAAHLPGAGHCGSDPRRAAAEEAEACRCAREWTACLERPEGGLGLQQLTRSWSERFGLGAAQFVLKLKQTARQRESQPYLSGLCTEAAVLAGDVGRQGLD